MSFCVSCLVPPSIEPSPEAWIYVVQKLAIENIATILQVKLFKSIRVRNMLNKEAKKEQRVLGKSEGRKSGTQPLTSYTPTKG